MRTFCTLSVALALAACGNQSDTDLTVEETSAALASVAAEPMTAPSMQVPIAQLTETPAVEEYKLSQLKGRWQENLAECKEMTDNYVYVEKGHISQYEYGCELPEKLTSSMRLQCNNLGDVEQSKLGLEKLDKNILVFNGVQYKKCPAGSEKYLP